MRLLGAFALIALGLLAQPTGTMIDVGGRKLHVDCTGSGAPAVWVVGAGYSFDWALVQPEVAKLARICTYDPAGFAWSDPGPGPECDSRIADLEKLIGNERVVLVGMSYGALVARRYAANHEVAGMVMVDHAFVDPARAPRPPGDGPVLISQTPIVLTMEDVSQFSKLPTRSRELHRWADSLHPAMPSVETARACMKLVDAEKLGDVPVAVVSTANDDPNYRSLQKSLLGLSTRSRQFVAEKSFHAVQIDQPEVVIEAIRWVTNPAR
jgi:pimeloyl-ACP methyl ester carboxylesterase